MKNDPAFSYEETVQVKEQQDIDICVILCVSIVAE